MYRRKGSAWNPAFFNSWPCSSIASIWRGSSSTDSGMSSGWDSATCELIR